MNQNENLIYTKVEKVDSSGLLAIDFFKNEAGYNKYFTTGKVENKNALGRELSKKYLRLYLGMYKEKLPASTVVISYLTDEGIKFTDFEISKNDNDNDTNYKAIINELMVDPIDKKHYESDGSSLLRNRVIYGLKLYILPHPKEVIAKKKPIKKKSFVPLAAPKLKL